MATALLTGYHETFQGYLNTAWYQPATLEHLEHVG